MSCQLFKYGFSSILERRFFFSTNQLVCFRVESINFAAGRSVKFGSDYNEILTTKEQQRQSILQVVLQTRRTFATSKQTFSKISEFFVLISLETFEIC